MKKSLKFAVMLLCIVMLVGILSGAAMADSASAPEENSDKEAASPAPDADRAEEEKPAESPLPSAEPEEAAAAEEEPEYIYVNKGEEYYAEPGTVIFNNGGTVYNNGALVYNNGGLCYNNLGTVYNNGGTVYANGGEVFDNNGTVRNYGGEIHRHEDAEPAIEAAETEALLSDDSEKPSEPAVPEDTAAAYEEPAEADNADAGKAAAEEEDAEAAGKAGEPETDGEPAEFSVELKSSVLQMARFSNSIENGILHFTEGDECKISPKPGYIITNTDISSGTISLEPDGSYMLRDVREDTALNISFRTEAPGAEVADGELITEKLVTLSGPDGAELYYTLDGSVPTEASSRYYDTVKVKESCSFKAIAIMSGAEASEVCETAVEPVEITVPEFEDAKEGYGSIEPVALKINNPGSEALIIKSVKLGGTDGASFVLNSSKGHEIPADSLEQKLWTLRPADKLKIGSYSATLIIELEEGEPLEFKLGFKVI